MTADGLGECTAERACIVRFRSGEDGVCFWHLDDFDPFHRAEIDAARMRLGDRMHLTIPEAALMADRDEVNANCSTPFPSRPNQQLQESSTR